MSKTGIKQIAMKNAMRIWGVRRAKQFGSIAKLSISFLPYTLNNEIKGRH